MEHTNGEETAVSCNYVIAISANRASSRKLAVQTDPLTTLEEQVSFSGMTGIFLFMVIVVVVVVAIVVRASIPFSSFLPFSLTAASLKSTSTWPIKARYRAFVAHPTEHPPTCCTLTPAMVNN